MTPVAVTGWSLRTPLGVSIDEVLTRLAAGERAAAPNPRFDATTYPCTLAAVIPGQPAKTRHARFVRRMGLWGMQAATDAMRQAGAIGGDRTGVFCGYGGLRAHWEDILGPLQRQRPDAAGAWEAGLRLLHPFWMLQHLSNNAHALLATDLGARGEGVTLGGANAGAQALGAAAAALHAGTIDVALVLAYDSLVEPEMVLELGMREVESQVVPGEAAAALVLERTEDAGPRALVRLRAADGADGARGWPSTRTLVHVARGLGDAELSGPRGLPEQPGLPGLPGLPMLLDGAGVGDEPAVLAELGAGATFPSMQRQLGLLGGAAALVQAIVLGSWLRAGRARSALGLSAGAPGLCGAVHVDVS
ncbi:MAG: hypothetical protein IT370_31835 [Deltaproteobacteria bacterium]|nr:hypothetical protein [Deltaproteobacteria bacterium]